MKKLNLRPIGHAITELLGPDEIAAHQAHHARLEAALADTLATVRDGWGDKAVARVREKGKLTAHERVRQLIDADSPVYEVGTLVNWGVHFDGSKRDAPGAGVVTVFARVHDRWCVVIANDNTVASGAWWPKTPEKIERAQEMALKLRLPVVYLVDCSGLFLPEQSRSFSGRTGAGHIFTQNARLADAGVPQIAGVFGDCIAGGGYMPIISDHVVMTESAYMVIAGAALIRGAKSLKLTSLDIGGPEVHVHQSWCADQRVPDDDTALAVIRAQVAQLPGSAAAFYRHGAEPAPPRFDPAEIGALFAPDPRHAYDIEEVIARLVDDSLFHEVLGHLGREMVTGVARIDGLWVGIIANRQGLVDEPGIGKRAGGALYREGIAKISAFARTCDADGIPLVWLQDISGFDIGVEAERLGLLGYGGNLIYTNATMSVPVFTILLRKASGAGYYAMAGMPYEPVVQIATPITRLAVMEGRTLAIATYNSKLDDDFEIVTQDPAERAAIEQGMASTAARIEADMDPIKAAARMDVDEVVPLGQLRAWLELLAQAAWQSVGYRRTKNPRIWSLHDLEVLGGGRGMAAPDRAALLADGALQCATAGQWEPAIPIGALVQPGAVIGYLHQAGGRAAVVAPANAHGAVFEVRAAGFVAYSDQLVQLGDLTATAPNASAPASAAVGEAPAGTVVVRADTDGTVYLRASPDKPAFVDLGAPVAARATIGLVEVMKTFTPVRAPQAGVLTRVLVADGQAVQSGEALFWVGPTP